MAEEGQETVYQLAQVSEENGETNILVIITQGGSETVNLNSDQQIVVVNPSQERTDQNVVIQKDNKPRQTIILRPKSGTSGQQGQTIVVQPKAVSSSNNVQANDEGELVLNLDSQTPDVQDVAIQTNATTASIKENYDKVPKVLGNKTFQCLICGKQLANSSILKRHKRIHTGVRPYQCSLCNKRFTQSNDLTSHMRAHTGSRPFKCEVCGKGFTQRQNVKKHMTTHTGEKKHECTICNKKFSRKHHMQEHMRIHNDSDIRCEICQKGFTAKGHLKRHIQQYHNDELSDDINKIIQHERGESVHTEIPVVNFATDENVETATIEIGSIEEDPAPQVIIGNEALEMDKTNNADTAPEILYRCDLCEKQFKDLSFLERHLRLHLEGKLYNCTTCNKVFNYKGLLKRHMVVHTKEKPYNCYICSKGFTQSNDLKIHIRLHTGQKPFKCEFCSSSFNQKQQLKNHRRKHTGEKPFECEKCGKKFSRRDHCQAHLKTHNNDHLRCQICGFTARHAGSLEKHSKKHEGLDLLVSEYDKPASGSTGLAINNENLKCRFCGKLFKDLTRLEKHEMNHEKSKFYTCKVCDQVYYRLETFQKHCKLHNTNENIVLIDNDDPEFEKNKLEDFVGTVIKLETEAEVKDDENEEDKSTESPDGGEVTDVNGEDGENTTDGAEGGEENGEKGTSAEGNQKNCLYCCSHCGKMLPWNADLVKHMETHLPDKPGDRPSDVTKTGIVQTTTDGRYMCSICGRNFTNLIALQSHIKNIHNMDISDYELDYKESEGFNMTMEDIKVIEQKIQENLRFTGCYSVLKNSAKSHGRRSTDDKSKQIYQCEVCAKVVKRKENLQRHRKLHNVIHKCDVCNKVFRQKNHLETHKQMKHDSTGGDPIKPITYVCDVPGCNKYFNKKFNYQRHSLYHKKRKEVEDRLGDEEVVEENLMVFECGMCNEAYSSCDDLRKHIDENHPDNEKEFSDGKSEQKDDESETAAALRLVLAAAEGIPAEDGATGDNQYEYQEGHDNTEIVEIATDNVPIIVNQDGVQQYGEVMIVPQDVEGASCQNVYNIVAQGEDSESVPIYGMVSNVTSESNLTESIITVEGIQGSTDSDNNAAIAMVALSGEGNQYIGDEHAYGHST